MNIIHFGIDYLRINFPAKKYPLEFEEFFEGISANSNFKGVFWEDHLFMVTFTSTKQKHILTFQKNETPVFTLEKIMDGGIGRTYSYILQFYSSFFHYPELKNILTQFFHPSYKNILSITRIDLCVDVDISIEEFLAFGYETQFKKRNEISSGGKTETLYLGARGCTNKKHFIRIYNKLQDSEKKGKFELYQDYFAYDNVTRIEVQINSQSCKEFDVTLSKISDADFLKGVFKSTCINERGTYLQALDTEQFKNLEITRRKPPAKSEILDKLKYAKIMLGYAKNLLRVGFDPIAFLIKHLRKK